jgi:hypothetical protein
MLGRECASETLVTGAETTAADGIAVHGLPHGLRSQAPRLVRSTTRRILTSSSVVAMIEGVDNARSTRALAKLPTHAHARRPDAPEHAHRTPDRSPARIQSEQAGRQPHEAPGAELGLRGLDGGGHDRRSQLQLDAALAVIVAGHVC